MITEKPNRINITELTISDPEKNKEFVQRKRIFDYFSSAAMKDYLYNEWSTLGKSNDRLIKASHLVMLFPDLRQEMNLVEEDIEIIKNPIKKYWATSGTPHASFTDRVNLAAAGRILFPEELKEWRAEGVTPDIILGFAKHIVSMPGDKEYHDMIAISEKVLHNEISEDKNPVIYPKSILNALSKMDRESPTGIRNIGVNRLLFPDLFQEFRPSPQEWEDIDTDISKYLYMIYANLDCALYYKALAAETVTIDEKGAHFIPPKYSQSESAEHTFPKVRRF